MKAHLQTVLAIILLSSGCAESTFICDSGCQNADGTCCGTGMQCVQGRCEPAGQLFSCSTSVECHGNMSCVAGKCLCQPEEGGITAVCSTSETCCLTGCIDLTASHDNCGTCGRACDPQIACVGGTCDLETCENGTKQCNADNTGIDICRNGRWTATDTFCIGNQVCRDSRCEAESCVNNTMRCHGQNVEKCIDGAYTIYSQCYFPQICDDESFECVTPPECTEDDMRCNESGNIELCDDQHWVQTEPCPAGTVCSVATRSCESTAECLDGERQCSGTSQKLCNNGRWETHPCPSGQTCSSGSCTNSAQACTEGASECQNDDATGKDIIVKCDHGALVPQKTCESNQSCVKSGSSIQCVDKCDKAVQCTSGILYICSNGSYEKSAECAGDEYCDEIQGKCSKKCGNGVIDPGEECDGTNLNGETCSTAVAADYAGSLSCSDACTLIHDDCRKTSTDQPQTGDSDYLITFDETDYTFKSQQSYEPDPLISFDYQNVHWEIRGKTDVAQNANNLIDKNGVTFNGKYSSQYIEATSINACIDTITFQYRIWSNKDDDGTLSMTVTPTSGAATVLTFDYKTTDSPMLHTASIKAGAINVTGIRIETGTRTTNNSRVVLDNIGWIACR